MVNEIQTPENYKARKITVVEPVIWEILIALTHDDSIFIRHHYGPAEGEHYYIIQNESLFCMDENGTFNQEHKAKRFKSIDEAKGAFWYFYGEPKENS